MGGNDDDRNRIRAEIRDLLLECVDAGFTVDVGFAANGLDIVAIRYMPDGDEIDRWDVTISVTPRPEGQGA